MKRIIALLFSLLMIFSILTGCNSSENTQAKKETKNISIEVINSKEESVVYKVKTEATYLREAMEEAENLEFSGSESQYGMMLEEVNGERAVYEENGAYWSIMVNGEYGMNGIDTQKIKDNDAFQIIYTAQ